MFGPIDKRQICAVTARHPNREKGKPARIRFSILVYTSNQRQISKPTSLQIIGILPIILGTLDTVISKLVLFEELKPHSSSVRMPGRSSCLPWETNRADFHRHGPPGLPVDPPLVSAGVSSDPPRTHNLLPLFPRSLLPASAPAKAWSGEVDRR